jgi:hypothetical protein
LQAVFEEVMRQLDENPRFAERMAAAIEADRVRQQKSKHPHRRAPGPFDPFEIYQGGETELRDRLATLSVEQLKDIVAEHRMDHTQLARKWKTRERLIDFVVRVVADSSRKRDAFRTAQNTRMAGRSPQKEGVRQEKGEPKVIRAEAGSSRFASFPREINWKSILL